MTTTILIVILIAIFAGIYWIASNIDKNERTDPVRIYIEDAVDDNLPPGQWHDEVFLPALDMARSNKALLIIELGCLYENVEQVFDAELYYTESWQPKIDIVFDHEYSEAVQLQAQETLLSSIDRINK